MVKAPQIYTKRAAAVRNLAVDFSGVLDAGELLAGEPTVTVSPAGPTIDHEAVSTEALTILGVCVASGQAVQFRVAGGTAGERYLFTIQVATDAAQTLVDEITLQVN